VAQVAQHVLERGDAGGMHRNRHAKASSAVVQKTGS
jgi:hypothetical protein